MNGRDDETPAHGVGARRRNDAGVFSPDIHVKVDALAKDVAGLKRRLTSMEARMSGLFAVAVTIAEAIRYYLESLHPHH